MNLLDINQLQKNTSLLNASLNQGQDSPLVLDEKLKLYLSSNEKQPYLLVVGAQGQESSCVPTL